MLPTDFKRILLSFADGENDVDLARGTLIVQVRDDLIEARLVQKDGSLFVNEADDLRPAVSWLIDRVARLPLLADRLLSHILPVEAFVDPAGRVTERLEVDSRNDARNVEGAKHALGSMLETKLLGSTSIIYLTSDAGEGKTTLIRVLAREQAQRYRKRETDWLLLPVKLGGRGFQRFDDSVVATLMNEYRFQMLYYEGFLELVRLGVIVPAFDGFEEVFIENSSGEAVSALGNLVGALGSSGACVISARNAYFEYQSYLTQAQLFDALDGVSAQFGRVGIQRWSKNHFVEYATGRGVARPGVIYDAVSSRLGESHPLLTRAVLVRRLVDLTLENTDSDDLVAKLGQNPDDYFYHFVLAIVEREANEKWIDRSGEPYKPLLSVLEHQRLLASVATEMWLAGAEQLRSDVLEVVADVFSESLGRGPVIGRQIRERLRQHSLLVVADGRGAAVAFDHEDFRKFYLGEGLGQLLLSGQSSELRNLLSVAALSLQTAEAAVAVCLRAGAKLESHVRDLQAIASMELQTSFVKENAALLLVLMIERCQTSTFTLSRLVFPPDALRARRLEGVSFVDCHFQPTSLEGAQLTSCSWTKCLIERLDLSSNTVVEKCALVESTVSSVNVNGGEGQLFDPGAIARELKAKGFLLDSIPDSPSVIENDPDAKLLERALRVFLRATQVNESVFRQKLGARASRFLEDLLPRLVDARVLEEVPYHGAGSQRRFKLRLPMQEVHQRLANSGGSFELFVRRLD